MDSGDCDPSDKSVKGEERNYVREQWGNKVEYVLSILGYLVGFANIWRFPYVCMKNGGGAFLIPYLIILLLMGTPLYFLEASLGQFTGKSFKEVWSYCPIIQGMALCYQILLIPSTCYFVMLLTWTVYYFYTSFHSPLPWSTCGNEWNTQYCFSGLEDNMEGLATTNTTDLLNRTSVMNMSNMIFPLNESYALKRYSAEEEFWHNHVLSISAGLDDIGSLQGSLVLCLALTWFLIYLCVIKGIRTSGKVVYLTATLPYLLLTVLLINNLTLPGSLDGVVFFIKPNFNSLGNIQVWLQAAIQVFYSLAIGWGGTIITLSSYNSFNNNCLRDSILLSIAGEGSSVFGGFVIFSALGFMAHKANVPVGEVVKSGPGLGFMAYPMAVAQMPLPNLWAVLFFLAMMTLGVDSMFTLAEVIYAYFESCFKILKERQIISRACFSCLGFLLGLPFCTEGGIYIFQLLDWYCAAFAPLFCTMVECLSISWVYGAERFSRDVEMMIGRRIPAYIRLFWCFLAPIILLMLMATSLLAYVPPIYGDYVYPRWAAQLGWVYAIFPIVPIFTVGLKVVYKSTGETVWQKLQQSVKPTSDWRPAVDKGDYLYLTWETSGTVTHRILSNLGFRKRNIVV
ncbi:sodium- and chloride-dependent glycine transporter 1-like [Ylistrum balloti]|uniref:sodium- and chloride-dependent glycine transporter 1-like n=1 Tax=Ylistrum balloti TaxID=509963 RepID=UPI0029059F9D|nr:sodium- and chloride-dependent glycine transporter 1-like [Ylistrum balloti]